MTKPDRSPFLFSCPKFPIPCCSLYFPISPPPRPQNPPREAKERKKEERSFVIWSYQCLAYLFPVSCSVRISLWYLPRNLICIANCSSLLGCLSIPTIVHADIGEGFLIEFSNYVVMGGYPGGRASHRIAWHGIAGNVTVCTIVPRHPFLFSSLLSRVLFPNLDILRSCLRVGGAVLAGLDSVAFWVR